MEKEQGKPPPTLSEWSNHVIVATRKANGRTIVESFYLHPDRKCNDSEIHNHDDNPGSFSIIAPDGPIPGPQDDTQTRAPTLDPRHQAPIANAHSIPVAPGLASKVLHLNWDDGRGPHPTRVMERWVKPTGTDVYVVRRVSDGCVAHLDHPELLRALRSQNATKPDKRSGPKPQEFPLTSAADFNAQGDGWTNLHPLIDRHGTIAVSGLLGKTTPKSNAPTKDAERMTVKAVHLNPDGSTDRVWALSTRKPSHGVVMNITQFSHAMDVHGAKWHRWRRANASATSPPTNPPDCGQLFHTC